MKAKRIELYVNLNPETICYYKNPNGVWMIFHPKVGLGSLEQHEIEEHDNGTITVSPSIQITTTKNGKEVSVHGYLKNGFWTDC